MQSVCHELNLKQIAATTTTLTLDPFDQNPDRDLLDFVVIVLSFKVRAAAMPCHVKHRMFNE